jgi:hypothetical protein
MNEGLPGSVSLDEGRLLLEEQRDAMLARDADRLEAANARLSAWIAACRQAPDRAASGLAGPRRDLPPAAHDLRVALDANAALARRSALLASRALDALADAEPRTYDDEGWIRGAARRRATYSA